MTDTLPRPLPEPFRVEVRFIGTTARVSVSGELDLLSAPQLERVLQRVAASTEGVELDLRALSFLDSTGLAVILRCRSPADGDGRALSIVRGPGAVQRVFTIAGVEDQFVFRDSPTD